MSAVVNSQGADYAYSYDALSRPTTRNDDVFAYNARSEVTGATAAGEVEGYAYDNIGNATFASVGAVTNTYVANGLNQYTSINRTIEQSEQSINLSYDADGNLVSFGDWSYAYDSAARLTEVRSNGVLIASNYYDHQGRRVRLVTSEASYTFIYDGWNVVLELVDHDGVSDRIEYYWGKDISGSLQGAGGVGGLLYLKRNGTIFVPIYDAYGNVMEYRAADGTLAASYVYDAFGRTVSQTGPLADVFRYRYSTKSFERETGLYYYGKRFYSPELRRWLNRDPIQESGGVNLYALCKNAPIFVCDKDGCAYVAYRRLDSFVFKLTGVVWSPEMERKNRVWAHEHIFFEDGKSPRDVGYFDSGVHSDTMSGATWYIARSGLKDACLRKAVSMVKPLPYSLLGDRDNDIPQYNCQDYVEDVLNMYDAIMSNKVYYPKSTKFIGRRN